MGNTESDAAADMADIEAEEARQAERDEKIAQSEKTIAKLRAELESKTSSKAFKEAFGSAASRLQLEDRLDYATWADENLQAAAKLNKSASRVTICLALAGMPNYEVNDERDAGLDLPVGIGMLEAIMPPATDDTCGSYGRPQNFFHQITRMQGKVISGKNKGAPINLIKILWSDRLPGKMGARYTQGYKLDSTGICYAHIHGKGKITKNDLVDYWSHAVHGREMPEATNPAYRAMIGEGPLVDESPNQWQTPGAYAWGSLDSLQRNDTTLPERYKAESAVKLSKALVAVHGKDGAEALRFLTKDDQEAVFRDVLLHAKIGNKGIQADIIEGLDKATYINKVAKLAKLYEDEHQGSPTGEDVVNELICRCALAVIVRVMTHRTGDITAMDATQVQEAFINYRQTAEHVKELTYQVERLREAVEPHVLGPDDYEPDEDMVGSRAQER